MPCMELLFEKKETSFEFSYVLRAYQLLRVDQVSREKKQHRLAACDLVTARDLVCDENKNNRSVKSSDARSELYRSSEAKSQNSGPKTG